MAYHDKYGRALTDHWYFRSYEENILNRRNSNLRNWHFRKAFLQDHQPDVNKIKKIKKTINLIGRDDSPLVVGSMLHKVIRSASSERHIVEIEFLEWTTMPQDSKLKYLRWLFESHPIPWAVNELQHDDNRCVYRFAYPTLIDL